MNTDDRCTFRDDEDGTSCGHHISAHDMIPHPLPWGPMIGTCRACAHTSTYTHYFTLLSPLAEDDLGSRSAAGPNHRGGGDTQPPTEAELRLMGGDR